MSRTITRDWQVFERPNVSYSFNKGTKAHVTTITIPAHSDWSSELHWHEKHREFLRIVEGSALVTVGETTQRLDSSTGLITIERGVLHEWKQDPNSTDVLVVEEWTDPADGQKELFFRNLCSVLIDLTTQVQPWPWIPSNWFLTIQLFVIFQAYDNYPVLYQGYFMRYITHAILLVATFVGVVLNIRPQYDEYVRSSDSKEE